MPGNAATTVGGPRNTKQTAVLNRVLLAATQTILMAPGKTEVNLWKYARLFPETRTN
jgi:hypothetical protein